MTLRRIGANGSGEVFAKRGCEAERTWPQAKAGLRIGCVCGDCNSGWMSRLESRAKPVIEQLLAEEHVILDSPAQTTLALWAAKCAMVYEGLRLQKPRSFTADERRQLRGSHTLSPGIRVWIAMCVDPPGPYCAAHDLTGHAKELGYPVKAYITTMCFGPLALQVANFSVPSIVPHPGIITADLVEGPWDSTVLQVWPILDTALAWPAKHGLLGENGLDAFNERWKVDS